MVRYGAYDGRVRIEAAKAIAREHAADEEISSFVSDQYFVLSVGDQRLLIDLQRGKYDLTIDGDPVGKYASWDPAAEKFEQLLTERSATGATAD